MGTKDDKLKNDAQSSSDIADVKRVQPMNDNSSGLSGEPHSHSGGNTVTRGIVGTKNFLMGLPGSIGGFLYNGVKSIGKGTVRGSSTLINKVATTFDVPPKAAGIGLLSLIGTLCAVGGVVYSNYSFERQALVDEAIFEDDCLVEVEEKQTLLSEMEGDLDTNALKVWSVCKALGYSDAQAAGVLGNFSTESGIDSTSVEGIYDEPYNPSGPKKLNAYKDWCSYTINHLSTHRPGGNAATDSHGHTASSSGNTAWYAGTLPNSCFRVGVGLGQFTGDNWYKLMNFVAAASGDDLDSQNCCSDSWYKIDYQLAFICCDVNNGGWQGASGGNFFTEWPKENVSSPEDAADIFLKKFEGGGESDPNYMERLSSARDWYTKLSGKVGDSSYANSILNLANATMASGAGNAAKEEENSCEEYEEVPFDIARAAVAYAHEHYEDSYGNNGTQLYQNVHDAVYPGDIYYQSCDRGVACAVRWAGADDNYPPGDTSYQHNYLMQHPEKWEYIGKFDDLCSDINVEGGRLQPGDVIIRPNGNPSGRSGHTLVYVSYDIVAEKYPNAPSNAAFVSASYMTRSAAIELWTGQHTGGNGYYEVYRCKQYEENSKYADLFSAMKGAVRKRKQHVGGAGASGSGFYGNAEGASGTLYEGDGTLAGEVRAYAMSINSTMLAQQATSRKKWHYGESSAKTFEQAIKRGVRTTQCDTGISWVMHHFGILRKNESFRYPSAPRGMGNGWKRLKKKGNTIHLPDKSLSSLYKAGKFKAPTIIAFDNHVFMYLGDDKWMDTGSISAGFTHTKPFGATNKNGWIYSTKKLLRKVGFKNVVAYCNITKP